MSSASCEKHSKFKNTGWGNPVFNVFASSLTLLTIDFLHRKKNSIKNSDLIRFFNDALHGKLF